MNLMQETPFYYKLKFPEEKFKKLRKQVKVTPRPSFK